MRILRDSLPFGALFGAPLAALSREVLLPGLAASRRPDEGCWATPSSSVSS
jgi:hypothetical protein